MRPDAAAKGTQLGNVLGWVRKERFGPFEPIRASWEREETSTPQIILATVTCLERAIEVSRLFGRA